MTADCVEVECLLLALSHCVERAPVKVLLAVGKQTYVINTEHTHKHAPRISSLIHTPVTLTDIPSKTPFHSHSHTLTHTRTHAPAPSRTSNTPSPPFPLSQVLSGKHFASAVYGLQGMSSDQSAVRRLVSALAAKTPSTEARALLSAQVTPLPCPASKYIPLLIDTSLVIYPGEKRVEFEWSRGGNGNARHA